MVYKKESGNALFLILIAVALFAALSYAVTQSGRGGSGIDKEQNALIASQIIQYAGNLKSSIQRLQLIGGCNDTEISFHYDSDGDGTLETDGSDDYYNPNSPIDYSCNVFHSNGANLNQLSTSENWFIPFDDLTNNSDTIYDEFIYTGEVNITNVGRDCSDTADTNCRELLVVLPHLTRTICDEINKNLGFSFPSYIPENVPFLVPSEDDYFIGNYPTTIGANLGELGNQETGLAGENTGCYFHAFTSSYSFYHTLIAR